MAADFQALTNAIDTAAQHANDAKARADRTSQKVTALQGQVDELRAEVTSLQQQIAGLGGGVDTQPLIDKLNAVDTTVDSIAEETVSTPPDASTPPADSASPAQP
jgi:cell division protein FtsB